LLFEELEITTALELVVKRLELTAVNDEVVGIGFLDPSSALVTWQKKNDKKV
jgi:hypothetical protein